MTQSSGAREASAMRGMHPTTSATSNLYDGNVTPTNDDGPASYLWCEVGATCILSATREGSSPEQIFTFIFTLTLTELRTQKLLIVESHLVLLTQVSMMFISSKNKVVLYDKCCWSFDLFRLFSVSVQLWK